MTRRAFVTGAAGFIGANLARHVLSQGWHVVGLDNLNDYYPSALKMERLERLREFENFRFVKADLTDAVTTRVIEEHDPHVIVHLAAQAGVRYSIDNPRAYTESNISGFLEVLEAARSLRSQQGSLEHFVYASSSSVYGNGTTAPYSTTARADTPVSLYAATKRANELMAYTYAHLYGLPATGLRFFTVYGPAGRPDMAYFKFAERAVAGRPIEVYNNGELRRDFTYIDDIVAGIGMVMNRVPKFAVGAPHKVYNIGNSSPERLMDFIAILEDRLLHYGVIADPIERLMLPMQPGDVNETMADMSEMQADFGFKPRTSLATGLDKFAAWFANYIEGR